MPSIQEPLRCPICELESPRIESYAATQDAFKIECRRCGRFVMVGDLLYIEMQRNPLTGRRDGLNHEDYLLLPYLSAHTRQTSDTGHVPVLDRANWRDQARMHKAMHKATPVSWRVGKLLELIATHSSGVGKSVRIETNFDYPLVDAISAEEAEFLLEHLVSQHYIICDREIINVYHATITILGWEHLEQITGSVVDRMDLDTIPEAARLDLMKAAMRFHNGDLSGALAAACGVVDSACAKIYAEKRLGDPTKAQSFQERINKALQASGAFIALDAELSDIGWERDEAQRLIQNLRQSLNQAAYVMQTLRSRMSDVHGSKPALKAVVFDSLKWSTIIASLLK